MPQIMAAGPSIYAPATRRERAENFERYLTYLRDKNGDLSEEEKALAEKQKVLRRFREQAVRSRRPLLAPEAFYRNNVVMRDDPRALDRTTLLLTFLYKFARHEWVGISAAWDVTPTLADSVYVTDKISRYHLAEEFGHMRLFHEMFRTFHLDRVEWVPLGKWMSRVYRVFPWMPEAVMSPPAFVSELMGLTLYLAIDARLQEIFADEPEARDRCRALLREIMTDEMGHVGQRRNYIGPIGLKVSWWMIEPMFRAFYRDIPESRLLFDIEQMIAQGKAFDYGIMPPDVIAKSWIPSYCGGQS